MTREEYEEIKKSNTFREDERPCREIVTKERLYERLNNAIRKSEILIIKEEARLDALRATKRNLDEYFEDLDRVRTHERIRATDIQGQMSVHR